MDDKPEKKKMGRPPIGKRRNFHCPEDEYVLAELLKEITGISVAELIRTGMNKHVRRELRKRINEVKEAKFEDEKLAAAAKQFLSEET